MSNWWEAYPVAPQEEEDNSWLDAYPVVGPEMPNLPPPGAERRVEDWAPPGMAYDPSTGQVRDTRAEATARREQGGFFQGLGDMAGQVLSGLPFVGSYLDEASGAAGAAVGQDPALTTERARAQLDTYREENPKTALGLQVAGGVTGALPLAMAAAPLLAHAPASLGGQALLGATVGAPAGAVEGLVAGYGRGTDDASRMAEARSGGLIGGGLGGLVGGAAPLLGAGIGYAGRNILDALGPVTPNRLGISREAGSIFNRAMEADGSFSGAGAQNLSRAGPDAMLADAGPNARTLLDTAIQRSGPAGMQARTAVQERAGNANSIITQSLDDVLGAPQVVGSAQNSIRDATSPQVNAAYRRAYSQPIDYASPEGRAVEDIISRIPPRISKSAIERANERLRYDGGARQIMADIADDGTVTFREMPNVIQADHIKRALDEVAHDAVDPITGRMSSDGAFAARIARDLRGAVGDAAPAYREALETAADPLSQQAAVRVGARLGTMSRDEFKIAIDGMTLPEKKAVAQGFRSRLDDQMAAVQRAVSDGNMDAREAIRGVRELSSRANREKVSALMGEEQAGRLFGELDRATVALELRASVADNSRTFARQSMDDIIQEQQRGGPLAALADGRPINATQRILQALTGRTPDAMSARSDAVYGEIADLLTRPRGTEAQSVLAALQNINQALPTNAETAQRIARGGVLALGAPTYATGTRY